ncbi:hypothetical protein [Muricoccus aerilatus]|uniref:hypothetical protein n=1 Tax=Muricoccus aerilatus TaxID=452982 RepID=UPI0012EB4BAD|nr:hypothetical protein [Roseomonas aerilata]
MYEDNDLIVRSVLQGGKKCFVTFAPLDHGKLDGFGEQFLLRGGYSAIHVVAKWNHWYQLPQMKPAIEAIVGKISNNSFEVTIAYGSSMGAYGALMHSTFLSANIILAFSPQFSIDPEEPPYEKRWVKFATKSNYRKKLNGDRISKTAQKYYFCDPANPDHRHVELYKKLAGGVEVATIFAEHHSAQMLKDAQLLKKVVISIAEEDFSLPNFYSEYHLGRRKSPLYWAALGDRAIARRPNVALYAANRGLALDHVNIRLLIMRCVALLKLGSIERAIEAAQAGIKINARHPALWRALSVAMQRMARWDDAIDAAKKAIFFRPADPDLHRVLLDALVLSGKTQAAVTQARTTIALAPNHAAAYMRGAEAHEANGEFTDAINLVRQGRAHVSPTEALYEKFQAIEARLMVILRVLPHDPG